MHSRFSGFSIACGLDNSCRLPNKMATLELDPLFTKALKLLYSKSKDAEYQLRLMVEEVVAQRKGLPVKHDFMETLQESKKPRLDLFSSLEKEEKPNKEKEREMEKEREKERSRKERELKDKEDKERREKAMSEKAAATAATAEKTEKSAVVVEKSSSFKEPEALGSSDDNMDTADFILDLGIACVNCQQFEVTSGNQLIECQECHNLYHQECHKPPVIGQDVNDPRFVWYCTRCVKSLEKMATKPPKPIKSSSLTNTMESSKSFVMASSSSKSSKTDSADTVLPFRRVESKVSSSSMAAKPMSGLVSLAANLSGKTTSDVLLSKSSLTKSEQTKHSSASSSSKESKPSSNSGSKLDLSEKNLFAAALTMAAKVSTKGSSKTSSGMQMANADKRLQLMKKKAAAKLQEKRSLLK
ncbi:integrator complex subunit 12 isoform X1 [Octopus sinensis]|uniref:Integrator complex subunit 12 n=1 Tax=Octopus sinensis TaxID=2607531 RepID=A0A7E6EU43_9MOLL|nr:integrator complex subunit 12 isoform X1 [Octopus sinensis]